MARKGNPTPGPWKARGTSVFAGSDCIARCDADSAPKSRMRANARVMAASLDLLAAAKVGLQCINEQRFPQSAEQIELAIAKAEN